jgi:2-dehydropantoate 2-reductase
MISAAVYVACEMVGPGALRHHGRRDLLMERSARSEPIAATLRSANIKTEIAGDVRYALWSKLVLNCAFNAVSAIVQLPIGEMPHRPLLRASMQDTVAEGNAIASMGVSISLRRRTKSYV